jgi:hypothetical protein
MNSTAAIRNWDQYRSNLLKETAVARETHAEKMKRIERLQRDPEAFFAYYYPNYAYAEPADFHKKASKRVIDNPSWYEVRAWSRELAKTARCMMEVMYLTLTGRKRNVILISHTQDSAVNLLTPYRLNLEFNQRIINDYGPQAGALTWSESHFVTKGGVSFMGFGAGQSPRGTRNEEVRPDVIIFDDIDTDEEVANKERIDKKWKWIEQAVIPVRSISRPSLIIFLGNIIGDDTCITRAAEYADHFSRIDIRDKNGKSSWPQKNSEESIDYTLSKISYASGQKEYFNNPIKEGTTFKTLRWDKVPRIDSLDRLLLYGDPSYSNKKHTQSSQKCVVLLAEKDNKYYVLNCRLDKALNTEFVAWFQELRTLYDHQAVQFFHYVENNSLQDPFFEQVIQPEAIKQGLALRGDDRRKPDKFFRTEGNLEPLNRAGDLIFNIREKENPHMKRLAEQFRVFSQQTAHTLDGPDAVEGGIWILRNILRATRTIRVKQYTRQQNRYN